MHVHFFMIIKNNKIFIIIVMKLNINIFYNFIVNRFYLFYK